MMERKEQSDEADGKQKDEIPQGYEEYLVLLQQRNRLLKKLKEKDKKQKDLEKREQGFSLYLNGANVDLKLGKSEHKSTRKAKTADVENNSRDVEHEITTEHESSSRAWTAPSKHGRKGWGKSPTQIKIKTEKGDKVELKTGKVTGKYSEDFEMYQSMLEEQLEEEDEGMEENEKVEESDSEDETIQGRHGTDVGVGEEGEDEKEDKLTLTIDDVKALRRSLEANKEIAESIRSIQESRITEESDTDDDIEEELDTLRESRDIDPSQLPQLGRTLPEGKLEERKSEFKPVDLAPNSKNYESKISHSDESASYIAKPEKEPMEMISAPRKSRPLSASRKQRREEFPEARESSEDIVSAIQAENSNIAVNIGPSKQNHVERVTKSAPTQEQQPGNIEEPSQRPSSIATASVDDVMIVSIVERVKKMSGKQQKNLLKMLSKLEELDITEDDISFSTSFFEKKRQHQGSEGGIAVGPLFEQPSKENVPEKASIVSTSNVNESAELDETDGSCSSDVLNVCLEITSNWGHSDMVGLTEVEFFDDDKKVVRLKEEHVEIVANGICYTPSRNLTNGKTKTIKERHMWRCQMRDGESVKLVFRIPKSMVPIQKSKFGITKIAIWNYNKSLYELSVGAKEARVYIDGKVVWEGIIDKGCGNQVFDYSKVINLHEEEPNVGLSKALTKSDTERCKTATLTRDSSELANLPKVETQPVSYSSATKMDSESTPRSEDEPVKVPRPPSIKADHPVRRSPMLRKSTPDSSSYTPADGHLDSRSVSSVSTSSLPSPAEQQLPQDPCKRDYEPTPSASNIGISTKISSSNDVARSDNNQSTSNQKPVWLPDDSKSSKDDIGLDDDVDKVSSSRPRSRPNSGRRSVVKGTDTGSNVRTASAGRRKGAQWKTDDNRMDKESRDDLPEILDENIKQKRPLSGRRSKSGPQSDSLDNISQETNERRKFREMVDIELEQSFNSINKFEHSHLGRITSNLDLEKDGDALDALIQPLKVCKETSPSESDVLKDDCDARVSFEIPTLPQGRNLILNLRSTWGDRHYIGLNGIEVFTDTGELAKVTEISADPADINILPEYDHDPRVVSNLIDGVYMTRDDMHLWLTPFTSGGNHVVKLTFDNTVTVAMLRIWNYNKSRIHSTRGVRDVEITLDSSLIFKGEIARASGILSKESEPYGDIILFTTDEDILEEVAKNDFTYEYDIVEEEEEQMMQSVESERPKTADKGELTELLERPFTCPKSRIDQNKTTEHEAATNLSPVGENIEVDYTGKVIKLNFTQTWGDQYYLGLTGLEILGENFEPLPIDFGWMDACPRDLNDLEDYSSDDRTLDKLIDAENVTNSDEHMWMIPFTEGEDHIVTISFPEKQHFTGIRVWNYNKTTEDTFRGAKSMQLFIDDNEISPEHGFLLRKGPGHCHFDFAQDILFNELEEIHERKEMSRLQDRSTPKCENVMLPTGFVFQIRLFSTWGDPYYVGLNGLEFYNEHGTKIPLDENNVTAYPHSVNVLEGIEDDARTPDKLVDGMNDTYDASHMWLAPVFPGLINVIYVVFDSPISLSMVKLWNYSKTGTRGVRQFAILVDDLLIYNGVLPQVTHHTRAILPTLDIPVSHHTILFTDEEEISNETPRNLLSAVTTHGEQDVQMTNDNSIVNPFASPNSAGKVVDPANRPMTSVTNIKPRR